MAEIEKKSGSNALNIYPNPARERVTISFEAIESTKTEIKIFDLSGKEVKHENFNAVQGKNTRKIDISMLAKGVYTLRVHNGGSFKIGKLVVN